MVTRVQRLLLFVFTLGQGMAWSQGQADENRIRKQAEEGHPFIRNYSPAEYNGHNQNWDFIQDSLGILYVANGNGVLTYDGVRWSSLELPKKGHARALAKDENGRIYVGGTLEFGYLDVDSLGLLKFVSLLPFLHEEERKVGAIEDVHATDHGVYFQSDDILYRWHDGKMRSWKNQGTGSMELMGFGNTIYVYTPGVGLMQLIEDELKLIRNGEYFKNDVVRFVVPLKDATLLIGTVNELYRFSSERVDRFDLDFPNYLEDNTLIDGLRLNDNTIAITSFNKGILFVNDKGSKILHITGKDVLQAETVLSLYKGDEGLLWAGLQSGIAKIEYPSSLSRFGKPSNLNAKVRRTVRFNNDIYVATMEGLMKLENEPKNGGVPQFKSIKGLNDPIMDCVVIDDELLAASRGLYRVSDRGREELIHFAYNYCIVPSKIDTNRVFVGHTKGIYSIYRKGGTWVKEKDLEEIYYNVSQIEESDSGDLWMRTGTNFIARIEFENKKDAYDMLNSEYKTYGTDEGLPNEIGRIRIIGNQTYYVTKSNGIYRFDTDTERFFLDGTLKAKLGFENEEITIRYKDEYQNLWIETLGENEERWVLWYNDGGYIKQRLNEHKIYGKLRNEVFLEPNDSIAWYNGDLEGLYRQDLKKMELADSVNRKAFISGVTFRGDSLLFKGRVTQIPNLPHKQNSFRFHYSFPSFYNEIANEYQYFLEGFDDTWSDWTLETQKEYTNIPEGGYTFRIRAKNMRNEVSGEDRYYFTILPPWYRSWWAYMLYFILIAALVLLFSKWRSRQLKAQNVVLEKVVATRTEEIRSKNQQLKEQARRLREVDALKTRFFANISHEFRTPVTLIKGPIDQMVASGKNRLSPTHINLIRRNTNRLLRLVNQLLDLSKLDSGKFSLNQTEGDCTKLLKMVASSFSSLAAERDINYVINITPERLWCSFDRDKLEQIVYNLLGNAFKFTPDGKKITFKSTHAQEKLNIDVSDTGIGIAENDLPHIFNRFYQVDDSYTKERSGSGIGLALTKELVNFMEGTIEVKSDLGKGSEFLVTLPMDKIRTSAEGESPDSPLNALAVDHKKVASDHRIHAVKEYTVLVVEDNNDMRYFIKEALEDNYTIIEANNGKTGLVKATKENPDIIIADIMMPKMDGLTLVKKLKTQLETSHIPVVLLTAKAGMENKLEGLELGADEYLTKPFDGKELNVRIRNLVASRKKLRALFASKNDIEPEKITVTSIDQRFMEQLKQLFEERYAEAGFGVPEMQNELGMGKTQLYRKLKSITDCSPGELLRNFRLKRAAQLLEQNSEHITQIAYSVGFNSLSYFTRRFKEFYRISPSEYANNTTDKRNQ